MTDNWEANFDWVIQGLYSSEYGWEDVFVCESRALAQENLKLYRKNEPYRFRIVKYPKTQDHS